MTMPMTTEKRIQIIVERNIPLNPTCETKRKEQIKQRIAIRMEMEELTRELQKYEPRTQLKDHPQY